MPERVEYQAGRLSEVGLQALATQLAKTINPPLVLYLVGELGAGKTTFTRALVQALGHRGSVKSPTYGLLEHYVLAFGNVLHLDLYRLGEPGELEYLGISDLVDPSTVLVVEWPERGQGFLPPPDIDIRFFHSGKLREVAFLPKSDSGKKICELLSPLLNQDSS